MTNAGLIYPLSWALVGRYGVYFEDKGKSVYNRQYVDELFDFLLRIKMKPLVEVGFIPGGMASGNNIIFWWRGNVTPPGDYQKWDDCVINKPLPNHPERT